MPLGRWICVFVFWSKKHREATHGRRLTEDTASTRPAGARHARARACAASLITLIARYEEGGSFPKPRSWANCDELETPYRGKNWYGDPNSSQ